MYCPAHFAEHRVEILRELMASHPLATLVTLDAGQPEANHIPLMAHTLEDGGTVLRGHIARANPLWQTHPAGDDALAIFQGAQCYVAPAWYPSKEAHGKVVPTWNYMVVHARGPLHIIHDRDWLRQHLAALTDAHEKSMAQPWHVSDAPVDFIEKLLAASIGIEIPIHTLQGKWKISQNRPPADHAGVLQGLQQTGMHDGMVRAMQKD